MYFFVLVLGWVLVSVIRGCNVPVITKTIIEQLSVEHKVLEGEAERNEVGEHTGIYSLEKGDL